MIRQQRTKLVHVGEYVAEVDVEMIETEDGWSPCLSLDDAQKLDTMKEALNDGDLHRASKHARVYRLTPVDV